jgi:hypothetical protein
MLDLVVQIGPCRIGSVGYRLLRVHGGSDQPAIVEAIKRAGGELDRPASSGGWRLGTSVASLTISDACLICSPAPTRK